jgi:hypothetical protein
VGRARMMDRFICCRIGWGVIGSFGRDGASAALDVINPIWVR